jgi:hypothetical protein
MERPGAEGDNLRRILLMIVAMTAFAIEDAMIKLASADMPAGQIRLAIGGGGGGAVFGRDGGMAALDRRGGGLSGRSSDPAARRGRV